jgi:hypothetical protein
MSPTMALALHKLEQPYLLNSCATGAARSPILLFWDQSQMDIRTGERAVI